MVSDPCLLNMCGLIPASPRQYKASVPGHVLTTCQHSRVSTKQLYYVQRRCKQYRERTRPGSTALLVQRVVRKRGVGIDPTRRENKCIAGTRVSGGWGLIVRVARAGEREDHTRSVLQLLEDVHW
eukprot:2983948-Rhodomonas_salina.1